MAQNYFKIFTGSSTHRVNDYNGNQIGYLGYNELFVDRGPDSKDPFYSRRIYFYSASSKKYRPGYVHTGSGWSAAHAYQGVMANSYHSPYGYLFHIRSGRRCRIYTGTTWTDSIYGNNGDMVATSGDSIAGSTYPDRLLIKAYRKNGVWKHGEVWADTDILFGYPTTPTVTSNDLP